MTTTATVLRNMLDCPIDGQYEHIKRVFLFRFVWESFFPQELKIKAFNAQDSTVKYCLANGLEYIYFLADLCDNKQPRGYTLPEFLVEHYHYWVTAINYLAYGNSELEENIPDHIRARAKDHALAYTKKYFNSRL